MKFIFVGGIAYNLNQLVAITLATRTLTFQAGISLVLTVAQFARLRPIIGAAYPLQGNEEVVEL